MAAALLAGVWAIHRLPPQALVPLHFDHALRPDRWGSAAFGLLAGPATAAGLWLLQRYLPAASPDGARLVATSLPLALLRLAVTLGFTGLQALVVHHALGA